MDKYEDHVMLALLPISDDWCKLEYPHMTLVYSGKVDDHKPSAFNELAKDAASIAAISRPITLRVLGVDIFGGGDEPQVDVLKFRPSPEVLAMRNFVEDWNKSQHKFNPHATIGPVGSFVEHIPAFVAFDRIAVGWGDQYLTFWLKGASR